MENPWWNSPQSSSAQASESCLLSSRPTSRPSENSNLLLPRSSEATIKMRKQTSSKEKQLPIKRLNARRLKNKPNNRYRASKKSSSNKVASVLAPTLPLPVVSVPLSSSKHISTTAANAETLLEIVIKTAVYQNSPSVLHAPRIQNHLTVSNSYSATKYSSLPNGLFPFPSFMKIVSDIIESIIKKISIQVIS